MEWKTARDVLLWSVGTVCLGIGCGLFAALICIATGVAP